MKALLLFFVEKTMKHYLIGFCALIFSLSALSETVKSKVDDIDIGREGEEHLIKMAMGRVAFLDFNDKFMLKKIQEHHKKGDLLEIVLDKKSNLKTMRVIQETSTGNERMTPMRLADPYEPTVLTLTGAKNAFIRMRKDYKSSGQCFNRAHVWTYEEFQKKQTNLNKVFLFFTSKYIRTYRFGWWFHVTPMAYVGGSGRQYWKILDRRYTSGPLNSKTWSDIFIKSKKTCKTVTKYSSYRENQRTQDCYFIEASMYFVVPSDLARLESQNEDRTEYVDVEVEHAYWDAFINQT